MKTSKNFKVQNPENPKIPGSGSGFENPEKSQNHGNRNLFFRDISWISRNGGAQELKDPTTVKEALLSSGFGILKSLDLNPPDSGYLSRHLECFISGMGNFFRGMGYPANSGKGIYRFVNLSEVNNNIQ